jgi:hypothetical protein
MILGSAAGRLGNKRRKKWLITFLQSQLSFLFEAKFFFGRKTRGKIFLETLFMQNLGFDGAASCPERFFTVFLRGVSFRRKIFTGTFLQK